MDEKLHHTLCPVCKSKLINPLLTVKDHTVSKEDFVIWQCNNCTLRITQDAPVENAIGKYYKSSDYISHTNTDKGLLNKISVNFDDTMTHDGIISVTRSEENRQIWCYRS